MATVNCPNCSQPRRGAIPGTLVKCVRCARDFMVPGSGNVCRWCGHQLPEEESSCPKCGQELPGKTSEAATLNDSEDGPQTESHPNVGLTQAISNADPSAIKWIMDSSETERPQARNRESITVDKIRHAEFLQIVYACALFLVGLICCGLAFATVWYWPEIMLQPERPIDFSFQVDPWKPGVFFSVFVLILGGLAWNIRSKQKAYSAAEGTTTALAFVQKYCPWCSTPLAEECGTTCEACEFGQAPLIPRQFRPQVIAELEELGTFIQRQDVVHYQASGPRYRLLDDNGFDQAAWIVGEELHSFEDVLLFYISNREALSVVLLVAVGLPLFWFIYGLVTGQPILMRGAQLTSLGMGAFLLPILLWSFSVAIGFHVGRLGGEAIAGWSQEEIKAGMVAQKIVGMEQRRLTDSERIERIQSAVKSARVVVHLKFWALTTLVSLIVRFAIGNL